MSEDGFLSRWSKLKRTARRRRAAPVAVAPEPDATGFSDMEENSETAAVPAARPPGTVGERTTDPEPADQDPSSLRELAEQAGLPAIEDLNEESDYSGFLGKDVPAALTRAALRKLWLSDPVFANLDGLNDYDLDYNVVDKILNLAEAGKDLNKLAKTTEGDRDEGGGESAAEPTAEGDDSPTDDSARDMAGAEQAAVDDENVIGALPTQNPGKEARKQQS